MGRDADWDAIRRDWELDKWTNRELAKKHGVSHTAINKRALGMPGKDGNPTKPAWAKNLAAAIDARAKDLAARDKAEGKDLAEIIEKAARAKADVYLAQRRECEEFRQDLTLMATALRKRLKFAADLSRASDELLDSITRDGKRYLEQRDKLHEMERKAYALDPKDDDSPEVNDDELVDAIQRANERADRGGGSAAHSEAKGET